MDELETGADRPAPGHVSLFLSGDVMAGRGIDQILPHPCAPDLHEAFVHDARRYVELAERVSGPIPRNAALDYVWGDMLRELRDRCPELRLVNLETSITAGGTAYAKGINYRMHPANVGCLSAAEIDCCVLANNHVLDWGREGLQDTLESLNRARIRHVGAGPQARAAAAPAIIDAQGSGRMLVFAAATGDSGVPRAWGARPHRPGVSRLPNLSDRTVRRLARHVNAYRRPGDRVLFSLHWGGNWGFRVPPEQRRFARGLIDTAGADLVHGHSSHHVKGFEVYNGRLVLYGCGDLLNDYEGIGGFEHYRGDLGLMYFPELARDTGELARLSLVPTRQRRFRLERATGADHAWLLRTLRRECGRLGNEAPEGMAGGTLEFYP